MDLHYYPLDSQNCTVEIESCKLWNQYFIKSYKILGVNIQDFLLNRRLHGAGCCDVLEGHSG